MTDLVEIMKRLFKNSECMHQIVLGDDKRRRETNARSRCKIKDIAYSEANIHVDVGGLREHTPALQQKAQLPCRPSFGAVVFVDDNSVE